MRKALLITSVLLATACTRNVAAPLTPEAQKTRVSLPAQVLGLSVKPEKVSAQVEQVRRPYVDSVAIFSLRDKDLLRATLQVNHFNKLARPGSDSFRRNVVGVLGSTKPVLIRVENRDVYATSSNRQAVFVWFDSTGMYVLSVHQNYEFPRTLLRRMIRSELR